MRTVTDITGFGNDSHGKLGKVAFTIVDQFGEQYLVSGQPGLLIDIDFDNLVQLTTATDNTFDMSARFHAALVQPDRTDLRLPHPDAGRDARRLHQRHRGGTGVNAGNGPMEEFETKVIPIDPLALFGEFLPELLSLKLELEGGPGMTIQLDNIVFADIVNGDFTTGDLTGWQFDGGAGAAMVTNGLNPIFVPEPATVTLVLLSLIALSLVLGRRRRITREWGERSELFGGRGSHETCTDHP